MNPIIQPLLMELEMEASVTKNQLEKVPADNLTWKPHEKSYSMGQLAMHIAKTPGDVAKILTPDVFDASAMGSFVTEQPASFDEVMPALDNSLKEAKEFLESLDEEKAMAKWTFVREGNEVFGGPRIGITRSLMFSHWFHHRGQMQVYLRLNDIPVPSVYGPTADDNPFM